MEKTELNLDAVFWGESANTALLDPRAKGVDSLAKELADAAGREGLRGHVVVSTSGSSGSPKFACLSREALLASAAAVNSHLQVTSDDRWLCALPLFHVGGAGIWARAQLSGSPVTQLRERWNVGRFCDRVLESRATLSALVPAQVYDLVVKDRSAPDTLRAVLVGGGALESGLRQRAYELGWPLVETFGMTEAGSQIATEAVAKGSSPGVKLMVLPAWDVRVSATGALEIRGAPLFSGYLVRDTRGDQFSLERPFSPEGWFSTKDRVHLLAGDGDVQLVPLCRTDDVVKILGENVNVDAVQSEIDPSSGIVIVAIADERSGSRLVAVIQETGPEDIARAEATLRSFNARAAPSERVHLLARAPKIPRTELGKVAKDQLITLLTGMDNFRILK